MQWTDRRLIDLFRIRHPIIQAPMAGRATPELASEVSRAGGLGSLGCAEMSADDIRSAYAEALVDPLMAKGADDVAFHLYGQAAAPASAMPAAELVRLLVRETGETIARTSGRH